MTEFYSHEIDASLLRAVNPEAVITLDYQSYNVGGVLSNTKRAYFNRTSFIPKVDPNAFHFHHYEVNKPVAPFPYTPRRGAPKDIIWPPRGLRLDVFFSPPAAASKMYSSVKVIVHHEMYDGIPLTTKWITVESQQPGR